MENYENRFEKAVFGNANEIEILLIKKGFKHFQPLF